MKELYRDYFGGNDRKAINRHSTRKYLHGGEEYILDRVTDCHPRYFTAYKVVNSHLTPFDLSLEDGISWKVAEKILEARLLNG